MTVRKFRPPNRLANMIRDRGGLLAKDAIVAAEAGVESLREASMAALDEGLAHERAIDAALRERGVEVIALAGYMRILTPFLVEAWAGRMLNIHPSLLPAYPGLDTHGRAIAAGEVEAGCTVHLVTAGVDEGPILGQARVPILPDDDDHSLAARVLEQEHRLYAATLADFVRSL